MDSGSLLHPRRYCLHNLHFESGYSWLGLYFYFVIWAICGETRTSRSLGGGGRTQKSYLYNWLRREFLHFSRNSSHTSRKKCCIVKPQFASCRLSALSPTLITPQLICLSYTLMHLLNDSRFAAGSPLRKKCCFIKPLRSAGCVFFASSSTLRKKAVSWNLSSLQAVGSLPSFPTLITPQLICYPIPWCSGLMIHVSP